MAYNLYVERKSNNGLGIFKLNYIQIHLFSPSFFVMLICNFEMYSFPYMCVSVGIGICICSLGTSFNQDIETTPTLIDVMIKPILLYNSDCWDA